MADNSEEKLSRLLQNCLQRIGINTIHVKVCRKTKNLDQGDFFVPKGVLDFDVKSETAKTAQLEATVQAATAGDVLPIASVNHDRHSCIVFHVDRQKAYSNIIQGVLHEGEGYGCRATREEEGRVIVNPVDIQTYDSDEELRRPPSLVQLRAIVLLKHVVCLLSANGHQAQTARILSTSDMQDLLSVLKVEASTCQEQVMEKLCRGLVQRAQSSPYRETLLSAGTGLKAAGSEGVGDSVVMNLRTFVASSGLLMGRAGYDKNLNLVDVKLEDGTVSDTLKKAAVMESITSENQEAEGSGGVPVCLHLVSQSLAYAQQQADLLWQMCTERAASCLVQRHLVFGTISGRKSCATAAMDAKEFYNVRHRQMTQAAMMKYGDHDQDDSWQHSLPPLTPPPTAPPTILTLAVNVGLSRRNK